MKAAKFSASEIEAQGASAFATGRAYHNNPYRFVPLSQNGPTKAAWWSAGWRNAETKASRKAAA
jgi:hypothetical protein